MFKYFKVRSFHKATLRPEIIAKYWELIFRKRNFFNKKLLIKGFASLKFCEFGKFVSRKFLTSKSQHVSLTVLYNHILIREATERAIKYSKYASDKYTNK